MHTPLQRKISHKCDAKAAQDIASDIHCSYAGTGKEWQFYEEGTKTGNAGNGADLASGT